MPSLVNRIISCGLLMQIVKYGIIGVLAGSGFAILCGSAVILALVMYQGMQTTYSFVINVLVSVAVNFVVCKFFVFKG